MKNPLIRFIHNLVPDITNSLISLLACTDLMMLTNDDEATVMLPWRLRRSSKIRPLLRFQLVRFCNNTSFLYLLSITHSIMRIHTIFGLTTGTLSESFYQSYGPCHETQPDWAACKTYLRT